MITRKEIDELFEWASTTKFPLYKLNNPEHYSNKRIDYSWHKLVDHKNKSTIRRKFMTERIIEIHQNPEILQIPIKIPSSDKCYMLWEDGIKTTWEVGQPQVHYVMDKEHEGFNYSDEEMIFLMLDVKKSTEVEV